MSQGKNKIYTELHGSPVTPHCHQRSPLMTFVFWPTLFPSWTPPCLSQPVNDLMFTGLQSRASAGLQTRAENVHKNKPTPSLKLRSKSKRGAKKGRRRKSSKAIFDDYGEQPETHQVQYKFDFVSMLSSSREIASSNIGLLRLHSLYHMYHMAIMYHHVPCPSNRKPVTSVTSGLMLSQWFLSRL